MDYLAPFDTYYRDNPDFNESDERSEVAQLFERQRFIDQLLSGNIHPDQLFECLFQQGIEPARYVDVAIDNIDYVTNNKQAIDTEGVDLWLPG